MKLIFESFDSPVNESTPLSEDAKERLASVAGKSPPGKLPIKSVHVIAKYLSVFSSLSKLSVSSIIVGLPKVSTKAETPLLSPEGLKTDES